MPSDFDASAVRFDEATGLVPTVVQDISDGTVLMLGYMNPESLARTLDTGHVTFYSRSRGRLWEKGETSGNTLVLESIASDCDGDALLVTASAAGPTCHTGDRSCFPPPAGHGKARIGTTLSELAAVIESRDRKRPDGSYTTRLLDSGVQKIAQKVGEEAVETALAAVADPDRLAEESADLLYHLLVLWRAAEIDPDEVARVLARRRGP